MFLLKEHIAPTKFLSKSEQYLFRKPYTSDQGHLNEKAIYFCFTHICGVTSAGICHPGSAVGSYGNPTGTLTPLQGNPWSSLSVRCSCSFHRRGCSISQSGSKVRGLCHVEESKIPKCGKLQNQTPVPGIALLKPAR